MDGTNSVTMFVNYATRQVGFVFKGSDSMTNYSSSVLTAGAADWKVIKPYADALFKTAQADYPGYYMFADGHSEGGGMAQCMALEKNIDGKGINSLPIAPDTINKDYGSAGLFNSAVANWKAAGHTFGETTVDGDPAHLYFEKTLGLTYLATSKTELASPYAACEIAGGVMQFTSLASIGRAMVAECAAKAHAIDTAVKLLSNTTASTTGDTPEVESEVGANAQAIVGDYVNTPLSTTSSGIVATAADGEQISVLPVSAQSNADYYSILSNTAATRPYAVVTGSGATISTQNTPISVLKNILTTVASGNNDLIGTESGDVINTSSETVLVPSNGMVQINGGNDGVSAGSGANVTIGGNGSAGALNVVYATNASVTLETNSRADVRGANDIVHGASGDNFGAYGPGMTVYAAPGDGVWTGNNGNTGAVDLVYAPAATVTVSANSRVAIGNTQPGSLESVYANAGDAIGLYGGNQNVSGAAGDHFYVSSTNAKPDNFTLTGDTSSTHAVDGEAGGVWLDQNAQANIGGGGGNEVHAGPGDTVGVGGGNNTIYYGPNDYLWLTATGGQADHLYGSGDNGGTTSDGHPSEVVVDNNTQYTNSGGGDRIVDGTNDTIGLSNTNGAPDVINAAQDTINVSPNVQINDYGNYDTVNGPINQPGYDTLNLDGHNDPVNDNSSSINYYGGNFTGDAVTGYGDTVNNIGGDLGYTTGDPNAPATAGQAPSMTTEAVLLNLHGGPVQTSDLATAAARFDITNTGTPVTTAWATPGEGILVNLPAGQIDVRQGADLVKGYTALAMLDANHDGELDAKDAVWQQLKVWIDQQGGGQYVPGALYSLDQLGITGISLNADAPNLPDHGNRIVADASFTTRTGGQGKIAGVELSYQMSAAPGPSLAAVANVVQAMASFAPAGPGAALPVPDDPAANERLFRISAGEHGVATRHQLAY